MLLLLHGKMIVNIEAATAAVGLYIITVPTYPVWHSGS